MAKLSEVLGALLKDVLQSGATADALSVELLREYREHPLLSQMPVPRVRLGAVDLTLRFALHAHSEAEYREEDLDAERELLRRRLAGDAAQRTLTRALPNARLDRLTLKRWQRSVANVPDPGFQLKAALEGDPRALIARAREYIVAGKAQSPAEFKRKLPNLDVLREVAQVEAEREIKALLPTLRRSAAAKGVSRMDLDVEVGTQALAELRESDIHELRIQLRPEELERPPELEEPEPAPEPADG